MSILMVIYVFFLAVMLNWSIPNFVFKDLIKYLGNIEIMVYYHLIFHVFTLGLIIYTMIYRRQIAINFVNNYRNLPLFLKIVPVFIIMLSLFAQYSYFKLLRGYDVNTLIPIFRGGSTIIIVIVGYFLYKEKISFMKLIGILIVLMGMYMVNKY